MIRHLVRLMWNRKRQNLLLSVEIFVAFLVVVALGVMTALLVDNLRRPLGFNIDGVWALNLGRQAGPGSTGGARDIDRQRYLDVLAALREMPAIERASAAFTGPYHAFAWSSTLRPEGRPDLSVSYNRADDQFLEVVGLRLTDGRWFSPEDDGVDWEPVVINQRLARALFGSASPIGQTIHERPAPDGRPTPGMSARSKRVVGVIEEFRQFGEIDPPGPVMILRLSLDGPLTRVTLPETILLRTTPGTTAAFEEAVVRKLSQVVPAWSVSIQSVDSLRATVLERGMIPLIIVGTIAAALMLMVALGLTGVVWQNVTARLREFGLRRAHGATAADISRQVILELLILTSFSVAAGLLVVAQVPLLPLPPALGLLAPSVLVSGVAGAVVLVLVVTMLCGWYPSRLATRVPPVEALHYE